MLPNPRVHKRNNDDNDGTPPDSEHLDNSSPASTVRVENDTEDPLPDISTAARRKLSFHENTDGTDILFSSLAGNDEHLTVGNTSSIVFVGESNDILEEDHLMTL